MPVHALVYGSALDRRLAQVATSTLMLDLTQIRTQSVRLLCHCLGLHKLCHVPMRALVHGLAPDRWLAQVATGISMLDLVQIQMQLVLHLCDNLGAHNLFSRNRYFIWRDSDTTGTTTRTPEKRLDGLLMLL